jgi:ABC-type transport system involved in cytochrome bd biosynthesis fused ATPase/permease subunit
VDQDLPEEAAVRIEAQKPPDNWPWSGQIIMESVQLRYRPHLPLVLHGVAVDIKGGEKVGVVGRTGAGKENSRMLIIIARAQEVRFKPVQVPELVQIRSSVIFSIDLSSVFVFRPIKKTPLP